MNEAAPVSRFRTSDPEILAAAIRRATLESCQLSSRSVESRLARVVCPQSCIDLLSFGPAMLFSGVMPKACYTLVFIRACSGKGKAFTFGVQHVRGYLGIFPPGGCVDSVTEPGYANGTLTVPVDAFDAVVERLVPELPGSLLQHGAAVRVHPGDHARLETLLADVERAVWQTGGALVRERVRRLLEQELLECFLLALRNGCDELLPKPSARAVGRYRRLRRARDFIAGHFAAPIGLSDLCAEIGLSQRGVDYLFRDFLGVTPTAYLRHWRLRSARESLLAAEPAFGAVKKIALDSGFWHLGHFAKDYHALFGENPSETLRRPTS